MQVSEIQKQYAMLLHQRGKSQDYIARALGISQARVSQMKRGEKWGDNRLPKFTRQELVDNTEILLFRCQMGLLTGDEEDFTRGVLNLAKLTEALNKLEEGNDACSTRNVLAGLELAMKILANDGKTDACKELQAIYDEKIKEL